MKNLEIAYLAVAYGMAGIMFYSTRHVTFPTVSHIALSRRLTRLTFFWGLFVAALFFVALMYGWVIPHYSLGVYTKILVAILAVAQILTGLFPVNEKGFGGAHNFFASLLGLCMFALLIVFTCTETISVWTRSVDGLLAAGMIVLLATSFKITRGEYMRHEKIFFAMWHTAVFVTVYFG